MPRNASHFDMALFDQIKSHANTPLASFVAQLLATDHDQIRQGFYFATDPLAAAVMANPVIVTIPPAGNRNEQQTGRVGPHRGNQESSSQRTGRDRCG